MGFYVVPIFLVETARNAIPIRQSKYTLTIPYLRWIAMHLIKNFICIKVDLL